MERKKEQKMNEEQQIKEMVKIIARRSKAFRDPKVAFMTTAQKTATALYNTGYRQQSEGTWIFKFALDDYNFYECSVCGRQESLLAKESTAEYFPYCHCGAKMKGGEG